MLQIASNFSVPKLASPLDVKNAIVRICIMLEAISQKPCVLGTQTEVPAGWEADMLRLLRYHKTRGRKDGHWKIEQQNYLGAQMLLTKSADQEKHVGIRQIKCLQFTTWCFKKRTIHWFFGRAVFKPSFVVNVLFGLLLFWKKIHLFFSTISNILWRTTN